MTLRADAERNRQRLLRAARVTMAERGVDVPLEDVARRAGVGIATLYRRFPTRAALIAAAYEDRMARHAALAARARRTPDAWRGFCRYLEQVAALQHADAGLRDLLLMRLPAGSSLERLRAEADRDVAQLVARAQATGQLRADLVADDVRLLLMAMAGLVAAMPGGAPRARQRAIVLLLDGCRAEGMRVTPLPAPPRPGQPERALRRLTPV